MADKKSVINIQNYKNKGNWNIGVVLFGVIFIYLFFTVLIYLTKDRISVYEVREGSILKDTSFTGIALRQETVINADQEGYVNYFIESGEKAAVGNNIYTLSQNKLETTEAQDSNDEVALSSEEWNAILLKAQAFNESFRPEEFRTARTLKDETAAILQSNTTQSRVSKLNTLLAEGTAEGLKVYQSPDDGVIEFSVDGYEDLELGDISDETLSKSNYSQTELTNNRKVYAGDPVYRLITDEEWKLVIKLSDELEEAFFDQMDGEDSLFVKVRFTKDNESVWGSLQIINKGKDDAYGYITFSNSMIRYAQDRFLDIELILEDESGLKIPKSSVTEKECFVIPQDYLTQGGASQKNGVFRQSKNKKGETITEFVSVSVLKQDLEAGKIYLDSTSLKKGDILLMPDSAETLTLKNTEKLKGVYNVNKGYAVFRQVNILCESEEYYIVESGNSYSLSNYDHIALDGDAVHDNDLVNQ